MGYEITQTKRGTPGRKGGRIAIQGPDFWWFVVASAAAGLGLRASERIDIDKGTRTIGTVGFGLTGLMIAMAVKNRKLAIAGGGVAMASTLYASAWGLEKIVGGTPPSYIARQFTLEELNSAVSEKKKQEAAKAAKDLEAKQLWAAQQGLTPPSRPDTPSDYDPLDTWEGEPSGIKEHTAPGESPSGKGLWWGWYPIGGVAVVGTAWALYARHAAKTPIKWPFFGK